MESTVPAESLQVADVIRLERPHGTLRARLIAVQHRVHGIKIVGVNEQGRQCSFGMKYGELAARLDG
ncbi:hypothetical protein EV382_1070 [Micromonospora violae]|uniref:Uncharacterized protein n=1 Tax=Micromonospora violae TaxID=1278207 RepID=A0A4Q7U9Z8_9ACTN|nr:hypothetical protein [Micromonospora violae]RZT77897.1 hypothetical protein EV382_1070 [Micromonospora violae]